MKTTIKWSVWAILTICAIATSCQKKGPHRHAMPESVGGQSEVLLVADKEIVQSDVKDTLDEVLCGATPGLNQVEPFFRVIHMTSNNFTSKFATMSSIIRVSLSAKAKEATIGVAHDVDARPQTLVQITAPNLATLRKFLPNHKKAIRDMLVDGQLDIRAANLRQRHSKIVATELVKHLGHTVSVPEDITFCKKGHDFLWASDRKEEKNQNFVFYTVPYCADSLLTEKGFAHLRDSVMKANIPGSRPDQWMETVWEEGSPMTENRWHKVGGRNVYEVRGLWQMHNGAMGGPFVSVAYADKASGKTIVAEGFVYSPSTDKRDLVRTMEAALRTVEMVKKK